MGQKKSPAAKGGILDRENGSLGWLVLYCAFLTVVFALGGGSRHDILSLVVLRPLAALLLVAGAVRFAPSFSPSLRPAAWFLTILAVLMFLQIIPLPPAIWQALPGRDVVASADAVVGLDTAWRELSLAPSRTRNALFSLLIPAAMLVFLASKGSRRPNDLLMPLVAMGLLCCVFSILQTIGPPGNAFYLYRITSSDVPVGLFSNRNHLAMFLASLLPILGYLAHRMSARDGRKALALVAGGGLAILFCAIAFATGSRAGFVLCLAALLASGVIMAATNARDAKASEKETIASRRAKIAMLAIGALGISSSVALLAIGSEAVERLFISDPAEEMRFQLLPHLWAMLVAYFPVGTGFGAFELAYKVAEPDELLGVAYLNQAHNDPLQFVIEGGLVALGLLVGLAIFLVRAAMRIGAEILHARSRRSTLVWIAPYAWVSFTVLLAGSIVDYPLRVPSIMATAVLYAALIGAELPGRQGRSA